MGEPSQLSLLEHVARRRAKLDEAFDEFHRAHPEVYEELVRLARVAKSRGRSRIGIKMLWEVVRWTTSVGDRPVGPGEFRLNNNLHSRYVRLIREREPDLAPMFETRELKSQRRRGA